MRKNYSSDREKLLKFEAEGREFATFFLTCVPHIYIIIGRLEQLKSKFAIIIGI